MKCCVQAIGKVMLKSKQKRCTLDWWCLKFLVVYNLLTTFHSFSLSLPLAFHLLFLLAKKKKNVACKCTSLRFIWKSRSFFSLSLSFRPVKKCIFLPFHRVFFLCFSLIFFCCFLGVIFFLFIFFFWAGHVSDTFTYFPVPGFL